MILCIETATRICSVTLSRGHEIVTVRESEVPNVHSAMLTVFIEEIFKEAGIAMNELDAVAVSMGPGSYTGLRIGVAAAKGLCYALDKPLIAVGTLEAMAEGMAKAKCEVRSAKSEMRNVKCEIKKIVVPMIDARRMEVYTGIYDFEGNEIREVRAEIIDENSFSEFLEDNILVFGGDGAEKCKPALGGHQNAVFIDDFKVSARFMVPLALRRFEMHTFENLAYFEPFYLKDFVAGKPNVKGLR